MRLERQPSLQLRESLNVCWEGWRESAREIGRGDERVEGSQVDRGSRSWQGYERYSQGRGEKRTKAGGSVYMKLREVREKKDEWKDGKKRGNPILTHPLLKGGENKMCEIQRCGNCLL